MIDDYFAVINILFFFCVFFQAKMEVEDLFVDLADGIKLLKLLEIISGEKLGKPNSGRMRVHKIENLNKSLAFLHTKVSRAKLLGLTSVRELPRGCLMEFFCGAIKTCQFISSFFCFNPDLPVLNSKQ